MGLIDCNRYICRDFDMGRPLLHAHTFTETADLTEGDTIYLPAGRIVDRRYERLDVHVKEDGTFRRLAGGESCAFAYAADGGEMTPLLRLRAAQFAGITGATTIPTQLTADPPLLRRALTGLLAATRQPGPPLEHLFGGSVSRQGVRGPAPRPAGAGFLVADTGYPTGEKLVEAAIEALQYGSLDGTGPHERRQPVGEHLPLLGARAMLALIAYVDRLGAGDVHAYWGAISISGYPRCRAATSAAGRTAGRCGRSARRWPRCRSSPGRCGSPCSPRRCCHFFRRPSSRTTASSSRNSPARFCGPRPTGGGPEPCPAGDHGRRAGLAGQAPRRAVRLLPRPVRPGPQRVERERGGAVGRPAGRSRTVG